MERELVEKSFKDTLKRFSKEVLNMSDEFVSEIEDCETFSQIKDTLKIYFDELKKSIGLLSGDDCPYCEEKDDRIEELEGELEEVEEERDNLSEEVDELSEWKDKSKLSYYPESLPELYKLEAFKRNANRLSVSEVEYRLDA
jgi:glutaredoxin